MADISASQHTNTLDRREFTHKWARKAIVNLVKLIDCLREQMFEEQIDTEKQLASLCPILGDLLDIYFIRKAQDDVFDFRFRPSDAPQVNVFGEFYANYHVAVEELVGSMIHTIWLFVFGSDTSDIRKWDIETIDATDIGKIGEAFCNVTNLPGDTARASLLWLKKQCREEYSTANDAPPKKPWWHDPDEPRPADYKYGPLSGEKQQIGKWLGEKPTPNSRKLEFKAKDGTVWAVRHSRNSWEVWFRDEWKWQTVDRKRRFGG